MENPRAEKVAIVDEIVTKLSDAKAVFVTEYRGMKVGALATLRGALRESGAEHKVYKNTLARFAAEQAGLEGLKELIVGPTALTFVRDDSARRGARCCATARNPLFVATGRCTSPASDVLRASPRWPSCRTAKSCFARSPSPAGAVRQDRRPAAGPATELRLRPRASSISGSGLRRPTAPFAPRTRSARVTDRHARTKDEILDSIGDLTVAELKELLDAFEESFVTAPPLAVTAAPVAGGGAPPPPPRRRRTSSTSSSPTPAPRRSRSSRSSASSPAWASRRPRTSSTAPPRPS